MTIEEIYDCVPRVECKGKCQVYCGPILCTEDEDERITGERIGLLPYNPNTLRCSFLDKKGRCSVYDNRPLICRLFGAVDDPMMKCPYGCKVDGRMLTADEGHTLIEMLRAIQAR